MNQKTTVIIGASAAGIACANKLRELDPTMNIICLTAESTYPYNRCLLADYLGKSKTINQITLRTQDFFSEKNITFEQNSRVVSLDTEKQTVTTHDGRTIIYDYLFLGMGKSAFIPNKEWLAIPGVLPFYDQHHATAIHEYSKRIQAQSAVVIGAGLTGLEAADALVNLGLSVEVIERAKHLLPQQIDSEGASFLTNLMHQQAGIITHTSTSITSIQPSPKNRVTLTLHSGKQLVTDLIVIATGGKLNTAFAQQAGIVSDTFGIITDKNMRTSHPSIFAGGDACSIINILTENRINSCLWADAVIQGNVAAHSIAGINKEYPGALIVTSSIIFGTTFVTSGDIMRANTYESRHKQDSSFYHRFLIQENKLKGFVMVGNITGIGQLRRALLEQQSLNI